MLRKVKKYLKFVVCCSLIMSLIAPSYAALSASDGSAFVTKAEFDSALADFNARLTTFEAGINSKIDSQVTSYLDRNGIWNGKSQTLKAPTGDLFLNFNLCESSSLSGLYSVYYGNSAGSTIGPMSGVLTIYPIKKDWFTCEVVSDVSKTGLVYGLFSVTSEYFQGTAHATDSGYSSIYDYSLLSDSQKLAVTDITTLKNKLPSADFWNIYYGVPSTGNSASGAGGALYMRFGTGASGGQITWKATVQLASLAVDCGRAKSDFSQVLNPRLVSNFMLFANKGDKLVYNVYWQPFGRNADAIGFTDQNNARLSFLFRQTECMVY